MSYEYSNLLPATDSAYLDYLDFHEKFGQEGNVMVFAIQDKDFYQLDKMNDWISMCDSLKALHGIVALVDITHSFNLHKDTLNKNCHPTHLSQPLQGSTGTGQLSEYH